MQCIYNKNLWHNFDWLRHWTYLLHFFPGPEAESSDLGLVQFIDGQGLLQGDIQPGGRGNNRVRDIAKSVTVLVTGGGQEAELGI